MLLLFFSQFLANGFFHFKEGFQTSSPCSVWLSISNLDSCYPNLGYSNQYIWQTHVTFLSPLRGHLLHQWFQEWPHRVISFYNSGHSRWKEVSSTKLQFKDRENPTWLWILDAVGCCFPLLRRVCWPALEECYAGSRPVCKLPRLKVKLSTHQVGYTAVVINLTCLA